MWRFVLQLALISLLVDAFTTILPSESTKQIQQQQSAVKSTSSTLRARKVTNPFNRKAIKKKPHANRNTEGIVILQVDQDNNNDDNDHGNDKYKSSVPADPTIQKRDRALLALYSNLNMPIVTATNLLEKFPQLYQNIPSLATRLLYLLEEVHIPKAKIRHMMAKHPTMMVNLIQDDPERSLIGTAEVLQTELHLTLEEISQQQQLVQMDRLDLKGKLNQLKQYFEIPQLQQLIRQKSNILTERPNNSKNLKKQICALSEALEWSDQELAQTLRTTDPILLKRDRALLSLQSNLGMELATAMDFLDNFPQLYTEIPSLTTRLLYLSKGINLSNKKVLGLIAKHPRMMVKVLLDNPEVTLPSTIQVLQDELHLSLKDIMSKGALGQLDRMELRSKLTHLKQYLKGTTLKKVVLDYPALLDARSTLESMKAITSLLQVQLQLSDEELGVLFKRYPRLLTTDLKQLETNVALWTVGFIGQGFRQIDRKGVSAATAECEVEADRIIRLRAREILIKSPNLLVSDNIGISAEYLMSIGCSTLHLGKIAYRRPIVLNYNLDTLRERMEQFSNELGMALERTHNSTEKIVADVLAGMPDIFAQSSADNLQPKFDYFRHEIGLSTAEMREIFGLRPHILSLSLEDNIKPKIEHLRSKDGPDLSPDSLRSLLINMPDCIRQNLATNIKPRCAAAKANGLRIPEDLPAHFFRATEESFEKWYVLLPFVNATMVRTFVYLTKLYM